MTILSPFKIGNYILSRFTANTLEYKAGILLYENNLKKSSRNDSNPSKFQKFIHAYVRQNILNKCVE